MITLQDIHDLSDQIGDLQKRYNWAYFHIREEQDLLPIKTVKCLIMDEVLNPDDITDVTRKRLVEYDPWCSRYFEDNSLRSTNIRDLPKNEEKTEE